jgi:hypothetical protein
LRFERLRSNPQMELAQEMLLKSSHIGCWLEAH